MFFLPHKKIVEAKKIIDDQKQRELLKETTMMTESEVKIMRKAQHIVDASVHPDTGDYIPRAF